MFKQFFKLLFIVVIAQTVVGCRTLTVPTDITKILAKFERGH